MIMTKEQIEIQYKEMDRLGCFTNEQFLNLAMRVDEKIFEESSGDKGI